MKKKRNQTIKMKNNGYHITTKNKARRKNKSASCS